MNWAWSLLSLPECIKMLKGRCIRHRIALKKKIWISLIILNCFRWFSIGKCMNYTTKLWKEFIRKMMMIMMKSRTDGGEEQKNVRHLKICMQTSDEWMYDMIYMNIWIKRRKKYTVFFFSCQRIDTFGNTKHTSIGIMHAIWYFSSHFFIYMANNYLQMNSVFS